MSNQGHFHQQLTPEEAISFARQAFACRELDRAVFHLGCAISTNPQNQEWLALLEQIIAAADNPLKLVPPEENYFALVAIQAYILARLGDYDTAINWLAQVLKVTSKLDYLAWIVQWLSVPGVVAIIEPETVVILFGVLLAKFPGEKIEDCRICRQIESLIPVLARFYQLEQDQEMLAFLLSSLLRKLDRIDEALQIAETAYDKYPSWQTAIGIALVYRAKGEVDQAFSFYQQALAHEPSDLTARLDIADMLCSDGRIAEGVSYYQQVLTFEPEHPKAYPHYLYYQFFLQKDFAWKKELQQYAEANPHNQDAVYCARELEELFTPYVGYLPELGEIAFRVLDQWDNAERQIALQNLSQMTISASAAPSLRLAIDLYLREKWGEKVKIQVLKTRSLQPRLPLIDLDYTLWRYQGIEPQPAVAPPSVEVAELIANLATRNYYLYDWLPQARQIAAILGSTRVEELLGVMVHPPQKPQKFKIWHWIYRVQIAAALTIAYLDEGWQNSLRKKVLLSLVNGSMDWTVETAIVALTQIALEEETAAPEILNLFVKLLNSMPQPGYCAYEYGLVCCCLRLPFLHQEFRSYLEEYKQRLEAGII